ncbi:hypothetical protein BEN47_16705 [Hymenobacter lapidarius]|uniref:DUF1376 domain-containing protein n=1 Tax=Hymenobacter lapidarius TaxID=1908237 RepID=A0A1G1SZS8_9BACT|nr:DUF1376 domain-containing protein [Hymenobacter lapidarius]OGX84117.1 hypothetical protein BEN47_16705 [Hymenobacter lapidarius]
MKPFWFAFNTAAWLSSKSVRMMSLAERGAYIGLLAIAWGEAQPGTLPAEEDMMRRLSEMSPEEWKISSGVILAMFPLAECGSYRYNPRLLEEAGKRQELSEKKAEAGRLSAERRAALATQRQQNANTIPTPVENNPTGVEEKGNQLQPQLQPHSSKEEKASSAGKASSSSIKSQPTERPTGAAPEYTHDEAPCFQAAGFFALLDKLGMGPLNKALYLLKIQRGADEAVQAKKRAAFATDAKWARFIEAWIENDAKNNALLRPAGPSSPAASYAGPNPALQVAPGNSYSREAIAARNVTKY